MSQMGAAGAVSMPGSADSNDDTVAEQAKVSATLIRWNPNIPENDKNSKTRSKTLFLLNQRLG